MPSLQGTLIIRYWTGEVKVLFFPGLP